MRILEFRNYLSRTVCEKEDNTMKLHFKENSFIRPFGTDEYIIEEMEYWKVTLPEDYKEFVKNTKEEFQ